MWLHGSLIGFFHGSGVGFFEVLPRFYCSITLVYLDHMLVLPRFYSSISLVLHVFYAGSTQLFSGQNLSSMEINPSKFSR